jgi:adenylosuccinate lyase
MNEVIPDVLAARYASGSMAELWSPRGKVVLERRLWIAVMRAQQAQGVEISDEVIADYEAVVEQVDLDSIATRESVTRHDVKARIDEFGELAGHEQIHRGLTSRDLTENVEQLQIRRGLELIVERLVAVLARLAAAAEEHAGLVMVARTHNVAAQVTTFGKRLADAAEETLLGLGRVEDLIRRYPLRGVKGPVGTRLDQLDLLGTPEAVDELEREIASHLGFSTILDSCGQVYPRSLDLDVVSALVQAVSGCSSLAVTLRLMAGHELVSEGFRAGQVGSSAMPHKMNARSAERIAALRTILDGHLTMAASLTGRQWNEGDVSCSAARRVMLPGAFMAADGLLQTMTGVLDELTVFPAPIATELSRDLPFLATTRILSAAVEGGLGREEAHELIKEHSVAAALARREASSSEHLISRIASDPRIPLDSDDLAEIMLEPVSFAGTAVDQVSRVVARCREVTARHPDAAGASPEIRY